MPDEQNNLNTTQEEELSAKESFKQFLERLSPYFQKVWESKKKLFIINGTVLIVTVAILLFLVKPYFDTTVTILPDYGANASSLLSQFSGLASLAGVSVGNSTPTQIYQELITSEAVLTPVIYAKYKTEEYPDSVNLIEYDGIEPDESLPPKLQKRKMFLKELAKLTKGVIRTDLDRITQILSITVRMPEGQLSATVANNIATSLDNYIQTQIRTSAKDQRIYVEKRLSEVKDSLTLAENKLKNFSEQNKVISQSPSLLLEQSRLQRNIDILNAIYTQLAQQSELAKIQEVKDTPVINIEETAKNPVIKTGPSRSIMLILIMFFAVCLTVIYYATKDELKNYWMMMKEMVKKR